MDIWQQLLLQLVLILINAFFAASEIAVISLNESKVERQAREGDKTARRMLKMVKKPEVFLSTIQIGITLAGYLGAAFAAQNFSDAIVDWLVHTCGITAISVKVLDTIAVILITVILSYFTLILGELVPKRIAMKKPDSLARAVSGVINGIYVVLRPVVWFMSISTNGVMHLMGINPNEEAEAVSEDEIRLMIDIGEEKGTIAPAEKEMIENIFEFNNQRAGDIMIHRTNIQVIWEDSSTEEILQTIAESGYSRFPVCGEDTDDIKGILRTREYLLNLRSEHPKPIGEILSPAYFVPESVRADILFRDMQAKKTHMAIIVDEYGGTCGLVTMEDLLEEIVGNIYDESDVKTEPSIILLEENLWRVSGSASIEEIEDETGVTLNTEDEDFGTLTGLVFSCLSHIPEDGTKPEVETHGLRIKVEEIVDHRVEWATISRIETPDAKDENEKDKDKDSDKENA